MNKSELAGALAERTGLSKSDCDSVISALSDVLMDEVAKKGGEVSVAGYWKAERTVRSARTGRNPQTGETLHIPAANAVKMSAGSKLKAAAKAS